MTDRNRAQVLAETRAELAISLMSQIYDMADAKRWLLSPQKLLDGACPVDLCASDEGWVVLRQSIDSVLDSAYV